MVILKMYDPKMGAANAAPIIFYYCPEKNQDNSLGDKPV